MSKIIIVESCGGCPYKKEHWSKPNGYIHEGTSCSHPDNHSYLYGMNECTTKIHPGCKLIDFNEKDVDKSEGLCYNIHIKID